jgi:dTDP-glucose pyrophosphorylase
MRLDSDLYIFSNLTIEKTIQKLDKLTYEGYYPALIIVDRSMKLLGTVTDGDIRRYLLKNQRLNEFITRAANSLPFILRIGDDFDRKLLGRYKIVPVVDMNNVLVDIITTQKIIHRNWSHIPLVINAGGVGSRLYPYTKVLPKPLIPVDENPIIDHIIKFFVNYGLNNISLILNYKKILIKSYVDEIWNKLHLNYLEESEPLGTIGGLSLLDLNPSFFPFFILSNCDVLIDYNLESILDYHTKSDNDITILSVIYQDKFPYGVLEVNDENLLSTIHEKPEKSVLISSGIYIINTSLKKFIEPDTYMDMDVFLRQMIIEGFRVGVYSIHSEYWYDMGTIEGLTKMRERMGVQVSHN